MSVYGRSLRASSSARAALIAGFAAHAAHAAVAAFSAHAAVAAPSATDIHDIRGPHLPGPAWWRIPLAVTASLALLGIALALWRVWRRRAVAPPAHQACALERLDAARSLMSPERAREFSIEVSSIVRDFIEACYACAAAHRTTDEFLRDLVRDSAGPLAAHRALLAEFLAECDLAKFGGWRLARENMERLLERARAFVLAPPPSPAATAALDPTKRSRHTAPKSHDSVPST